MSALWGSEAFHRLVEDVSWIALGAWCIGVHFKLMDIERALAALKGER